MEEEVEEEGEVLLMLPRSLREGGGSGGDWFITTLKE